MKISFQTYLFLAISFYMITLASSYAQSRVDNSSNNSKGDMIIIPVKITDSTFSDFLRTKVINHAIINGKTPRDYDIYIRKIGRESGRPEFPLSITIEKTGGFLKNSIFAHTEFDGYNVFADEHAYYLFSEPKPYLNLFPTEEKLFGERSLPECDQWVLEYWKDFKTSRFHILNVKERTDMPSLESAIDDVYRKCQEDPKYFLYIEEEKNNHAYAQEGTIKLPNVKIDEPIFLSILDSITSHHLIPTNKDPERFDIYIRMQYMPYPREYTQPSLSVFIRTEDTEHTIFGNISSATKYKGYNVFMNDSFTNKYTSLQGDSIEVAISHSEDRHIPSISSEFVYSITNILDPTEKPNVVREEIELDSPLSREQRTYRLYFRPF